MNLVKQILKDKVKEYEKTLKHFEEYLKKSSEDVDLYTRIVNITKQDIAEVEKAIKGADNGQGI